MTVITGGHRHFYWGDMFGLIFRLIDSIHKLSINIKEGAKIMSASTDALTAAVSANTTAVNNAVAALGNVTNPADVAAVTVATTQIAANTAALVAATPVSPSV